uniref:Ig-like domain-containing protein n=1 Tax=Sphaeramia orbicularis TaxID=375764 RepID=A0A673CKZ2_9TELE
PLNAAVGGNVIFTTTLDPTPTPLQSIVWQFKGGIIITYTSAGTTPGPGYEDRVTLFSSTGSLELRNVSTDDSGSYTVAIIPHTGAVLVGETTLSFSSVRLSCSSSGSSPSFHWFNDSSEVTADRVQITDGGSTMTIVNVTRYDQGPFRCSVSNLVSNGTSDPVTFTISYGPYNVKISGPTKLEKGKNLELKCIAESVPYANYTWIRDGERILNNSDMFIKQNVQTSATYTCEAKNSVTGRLMVNIKPVYFPSTVPVSNVKITTSSTDLMEFSSVRLSCSSSGSSPSFRWFNDSSEVTADRVQITDRRSTMTIVSVTRYDQGPFKCFVSNLVSDGTSDPVTFTISYGPENVTLKVSPSQKHHPEGSDVTLSCSAVSEPTAEFTWFFNGVLQSGTGPEFRLMNIQMNHSGSYSCQAFNSKTMRNETSQPLLISVLSKFALKVPVSNVKITTSSTDLMEFSSVRLSCSSSGSSLSFRWLNDSSEVTADRVQITDGGSTMTIVNVTRYDQGPFRCSVSNLVSDGTSDPVTFTISYGPENVTLKVSPSQKHHPEGSDVTLSCSAVSEPTAEFTWFCNGVLQSGTGPEFRLMNIQMHHSGSYSCQAFNSKTIRNETSEPLFISVLSKFTIIHTQSLIPVHMSVCPGVLECDTL